MYNAKNNIVARMLIYYNRRSQIPRIAYNILRIKSHDNIVC